MPALNQMSLGKGYWLIKQVPFSGITYSGKVFEIVNNAVRRTTFLEQSGFLARNSAAVDNTGIILSCMLSLSSIQTPGASMPN